MKIIGLLQINLEQTTSGQSRNGRGLKLGVGWEQKIQRYQPDIMFLIDCLAKATIACCLSAVEQGT